MRVPATLDSHTGGSSGPLQVVSSEVPGVNFGLPGSDTASTF